MLTGSRILLTSPNGELTPLTPLAPVRSSTGLGWRGMHLEELATPPMEAPVAAPREDLVWVQLSPLLRYELHQDGAWQPLRTAAGTVGVRPRGVVHARRWHDEARAVVVALGAGLLDEAADALGLRGTGMRLATGPDATARHLLLALHHEVESGGAGGLLFAESVGRALAVHLLRHYAPTLPDRGDTHGRLTRSQLRAALEFIASHLAGNPSLAQIAAATGLSPSHFARRFKATVGLSPHQFLLQARIERARCLLRDRRQSLVEIALATGFASQSHFTAAFRRFTGVTPKRYRERV